MLQPVSALLQKVVSADASREFDSWLVEDRTGAKIVSSSGDAAGMPHKRQLVATEIGPAVTAFPAALSFTG